MELAPQVDLELRRLRWLLLILSVAATVALSFAFLGFRIVSRSQAVSGMIAGIAASALIVYVGFVLASRVHRQMTHRLEDWIAMDTVAAAIGQCLRLDDLGPKALDTGIKLSHAELGAIHLLDPLTGTLQLMVQRQLNPELAHSINRVPLGEGIIGLAAETRRPQWVSPIPPSTPLATDTWGGGALAVEEDDQASLLTSVLDPTSPTGQEERRVRVGQPAWVAAVPLLDDGELLGTLYVSGRAPLDATPAAQLGRLEQIGRRIATGISLARRYEDQEKRAQRLRAVNVINREIAAILDQEVLLPRVAQLLQETFGYYNANVFLIEGEDQEVVLHAGHGGYEAEPPVGSRIPVGQGVVGWVARTSEALLVNDVSSELQFTPHVGLPWTRSELAVPIRLGQKVLGVLDLQSTMRGHFGEADIVSLSTVADQIAVAMQNARLYRRVQDQLRQLRAAQERLVHTTRLAMAGELAAGVAHEINNPLAVIIGTTQLLESAADLPAESLRDVRQVAESAQRIATIVRAFSEVAETVPGNYGPVDLNQVVRACSQRLEDQAQLAGVTLQMALDESLPLTRGNPSQLLQVFEGLCLNALEAMSNDKIRGGELCMTTARDVGGVVIRISDTGPGIRPEHLPRIFDPTFTTKIDRGTVRGVGLGLFTAQAVIQAHQGKIEVESSLGSGTTFSIWLPAGEMDLTELQEFSTRIETNLKQADS
jgi:signal transduction histidine kinase